MRRREFITLLGGVAVAPAIWPLAARAQQPGKPVIGWLGAAAADAYVPFVAAFSQGLAEIGYAVGRNVAIEFRWAEGRYDRISALVADLVNRQVTIIAASGGSVTARAAMVATTTIPIVFNIGDDPVQIGLVMSLNRPGRNITGVSWFSGTLGAKRLEVMRELVPKAKTMALLLNADQPGNPPQIKDALEAARTLGLRLEVLYATDDASIDAAFAKLAQLQAGGLLVGADTFLFSRRDRMIGLAARYALPTVYVRNEAVRDGGLVSYGTNLRDAYRRQGVYAGRILKGEKPADLPVEQSVKIELIINLKTAKALGITVPGTLLARADEVIE